MKTVEKHVLDALDVTGMLAYLSELIAIPSLGGQETPAQENMAGKMEDIGLDVDVWELDFEELGKHPAFSYEVERTEGLGVVGTLGEDRGGRSLIFNGHIDVVPPGDDANWETPPFESRVREGSIYGRGSLDMKGGLCCALFAAKALKDAGVHLKGRLMVESVIGEEDGGTGALATVLRGYKADGAVIPEPTALAVIPAQAGAMNFRVTVPGLSAHGCMREDGVSAIEKFIPIYQALLDLEHARNQGVDDPLFARYTLPYPLSVGTLQSGNWASTVPESLTFEGRYGVAIGEDMLSARRDFEAAVAQTAEADPWLRDHPPVVTWWGGQFAPARVDVDHPIVGAVQSAYGEMIGEEPEMHGVTYGADMRLLVNEGKTPAVLFGPGDVRGAHKPNEHVAISDLVTVASTLALTALRFCGYEEA